MSLSPGPLTPHGNGFSTWHAYDPACKAELWSTSFSSPEGTVLFDPIDWPEPSPLPSPPVHIVRTNGNHDRACHGLIEKTKGRMTSSPPKFQAIPLPGAGEAETAYFHPATRTLVVGDALINLAPHGLMLLPEKYCTDPSGLKKSLHKLLDFPIQRIFFAHGDPILQDSQERIRKLLP